MKMKRIVSIVALSLLLAPGLISGKDSMTVGAFPQKIAHKCPFDPGGPEDAASDFTVCGGLVLAGTDEGVLVFEGGAWKPAGLAGGPYPVERVGCDGNDLLILTGDDHAYRFPLPNQPRAGGLSSARRAALSAGERASLEEDDDEEAPYTDGIPNKDVIAWDNHDGVQWVGTSLGAARWDGLEWQYFQGKDYLADDRVEAVKALPSGDGLLITSAGVTWIEYRMMTFLEKAEHMERATRERHVRHNLVSDSRFEEPGDPSTNTLATSDNDGLWTAMYIAGECYRYAATGDPEAKRFARQSFESLMFLETVNEIPGFVSRSFALPDEPHGSGEWDHITSDGQWRWKGDTSSDEIDGHYYGYSIYYDLCAGEDEKPAIREKIRLITDYIIDNDFFLIDVDGEPTTWGRWNFIGERRYLIHQRGLNSLEMLSYLKSAYHITGDEKYQDVYLELAHKYDYAKFTVKQKLDVPTIVNHSDDELAFLAYYPLLKYEDDPELLEYYHKSITRSWEIERPERCPLFNFIHGAVMPEGTDFDLEGSLFTLRHIPLGLVRWGHQNSRRDDVRIKFFPGRFKEKESATPLPPDEREVMKWNGNPYRLDSDRKGTSEEAGTYWLLPYWMGRYYGFIVEEGE